MIACSVAGKQKSHDICEAFIRGARSDDATAVFYGVDGSNLAAWRAARDYWYIDNSYFDQTRTTHLRVTRNGLQHSGAGASDGKRFDALNIRIEPWRVVGRHVVVCPQSDTFMRDVVGYRGSWLDDVVARLRRVTRRELRVRAWDRDKIALSRSLPDDLIGAWALVTHSSAAAVTAVLSGVPVVATGSCAAWSMGGTLDEIEWLPERDDRLLWASVLADNQFTLDEMRSGVAWDRLAGRG